MRGTCKPVIRFKRLRTRSFWLIRLGSWWPASSPSSPPHSPNVSVFEVIELKTYDLRFLSRGPQTPSSAVAMVVNDEQSLEAEGCWPRPRSKFAALVDVLSREGAKVG
jgi:hypothetical protein